MPKDTLTDFVRYHQTARQSSCALKQHSFKVLDVASSAAFHKIKSCNERSQEAPEGIAKAAFVINTDGANGSQWDGVVCVHGADLA
jgi:hypothetical protein